MKKIEDGDWDEYDCRWATADEFKSTLDVIPFLFKDQNQKTCENKGGVPLAYLVDPRGIINSQVFVDQKDVHTIVMGSTGSKKTRLVVMPTLYYLINTGESIVATDPKGELYAGLKHELIKNDYKTIIINLRNPMNGSCWNPLELPYDFYMRDNKDKARELLDDLVHNIIPSVNDEDPFWENSAQDFLLGLIELLFKNSKNRAEINLKSVCLLKSQAMGNDYIQEKYYNLIDRNSFEYVCLSGTVEAPENTRRSILSVFDQNMRMFSSQDALIDMLSSNDVDFSQIGKKKTAVFIILPDEKTTYHKLVSIFIKQCYEQLIMTAQNETNAKLPVRVNFVLDEFSSLPTIVDFPSMITASRSRNIRFDLVIQSEHQLKSKYKNDSETIKSNCSNWIFLTSRELPLLKELSEMAGTGPHGDALISISKLQRLSKELGEALVFHDRSFPRITRLKDISDIIPEIDENIKQYANNDVITQRKAKDLKYFNFIEFCNSINNKTVFENISLFDDQVNDDISDVADGKMEIYSTIIDNIIKETLNEQSGEAHE